MVDIKTEQNVTDRETNPRVPETVGRGIELYLRVADRLASAIWAVVIAMATVLTLIVVSQVVTRYVLGYITTWGNEFVRYLMIWFAMLLAGVLVYEDSHLQVELLFQKASIRTRRIVRSIQLLVVAGFGMMILDYGVIWASTSGFYSTTPALDSVTPFEFHMAYAYAVIPFSGLLIMFFAFAKLLEINYYPGTIDEDYAARFEVEDEPAGDETERSSDGRAREETVEVEVEKGWSR